MKDSEIATSALKILNGQGSRTTAEIADQVAKLTKQKVSESEIFDALVKAEATGKVKRTRGDKFDEFRPVTTTSWTLLVTIPERDIQHPSIEVPVSEIYTDGAMIVVSQPIFLSTRGLNIKSLGIPVLEVREAMQKMVMDAREELLIACPYYDELFIDVLNTSPGTVAKLKRLSILAENTDPILMKACRLFPNAKVKTLYGSTVSAGGQGFKVQGIHAKIMIADRSQVLVGSFNFRSSHVTYNVDLGILSRGKIAEHYAQIFDSIWGLKM